MPRPKAFLLALVAAALCVARLTDAQGTCPSVTGYTFYRLQEVVGALSLASLNLTTTNSTPAAVAAACNKTPRCTAFTAAGDLLIVPMVPFFSVIDGSAADAKSCDGVYISSRTITGFRLPAGFNGSDLRETGRQKAQDMQAAIAAAQKVAAKLLAKGLNPRKAASLPKEALLQAFTDAQTPLAQTSTATGTYTYGDVLAALSYPEWDSRAANGTSYSYISPVKDQGSCGSCVAFAVTGAAEAAVGTINGSLTNTNDFSEQWLFFCNGKYFPSCDYGWYGSQAAAVFVGMNIPYEVNYPYAPSSTTPCALKSAPERRAGGNFTQTTYYDLTLAKAHIRKYGSVSSYFAVYNDFFYWTASSPPYAWNGYSALAGYHQVLVVGYSDTGSYWIVKNSWGTGWGDKGYFRMSYSANVGFMTASGDSILGLGWVPPASPSPPPASPSPAPSPSPSPTPSPSPSPSPTPSPFCGDGTCGANETCADCSVDCGTCVACNDGVCNGGETCLTCPTDCRVSNITALPCCGDGFCNAAGGESCASCPKDCGVCPTCNRNGVCEPALGEKCYNSKTGSGCPECGSCTGPTCGDGKCSGLRKGYSETCGSCPTDCGICSTKTFCGDNVCNGSETVGNCARDCKASRFTRVAPGQANKRRAMLRMAAAAAGDGVNVDVNVDGEDLRSTQQPRGLRI